MSAAESQQGGSEQQRDAPHPSRPDKRTGREGGPACMQSGAAGVVADPGCNRFGAAPGTATNLRRPLSLRRGPRGETRTVQCHGAGQTCHKAYGRTSVILPRQPCDLLNTPAVIATHGRVALSESHPALSPFIWEAPRSSGRHTRHSFLWGRVSTLR